MKILSIDDSKAVHAFLDMSLKTTDIQVTHAMSGRDGLELLAKDGQHFDLVLLDWEMPDITGPEVLKKLRDSGFHLPVIMLTSKDRIEDIQAMIEAGASEYLMKPFTPEILIEKINITMEKENSCEP